MKVDLLISTMNYKDGGLDLLLETVPSWVKVIVVNQVAENFCGSTEPFEIKPNVTCYSFRETGLSKSRNRLLQLTSGEIGVVSDDDVLFVPGAFEAIASAFNSYTDDVITFKMVTPEREPRKRYSTRSFIHNKLSICSVSSCEIAFRSNSVKKNGILYDEKFGLGSRYPIGEEIIFLKDCLEKGLGLRFVPTVISSHPVESTGRHFTLESEFNRGALFRRLFGVAAIIVGIVFYLKKRNDLAESGTGYMKTLRRFIGGVKNYANDSIPKAT